MGLGLGPLVGPGSGHHACLASGPDSGLSDGRAARAASLLFADAAWLARR